MANSIIKVQRTVGGTFKVDGLVKCVYDTNGMGDLVPVWFEQNGQNVEVSYSPHGQLYYRYKKTKASGPEADKITFAPIGFK